MNCWLLFNVNMQAQQIVGIDWRQGKRTEGAMIEQPRSGKPLRNDTIWQWIIEYKTSFTIRVNW